MEWGKKKRNDAKRDNSTFVRAVAICYKPFLKPEEAQIYCNLGHTQLAKRMEEAGLYKSAGGYFRRKDLDRMMEGGGDKN